MINIEEICQGNYVLYANKEYWASLMRDCSAIQGISLPVKVDSDIYREMDSNPDLFDPVPLTEEWQEKRCGFTKAVNDEWGGYLSPYFNVDGREFRVRILDNKWHTDYAPVKLDYVHQLQNLIRLLTGKELIINF